MSVGRAPWEADHPMDEERRRALVARVAPEFAGAPLRELGEGWDYRACIAGDQIFRIAKRADVGQRLEVEAALVQLVAPRVSLAVPRLAAHGAAEGAPHGFTRHEALLGVPLSRYLPSQRQSTWLATRLGRFLAELHAIPVESARAAGASHAGPQAMAGAARRSRARLRALAPQLERALVTRIEELLARSHAHHAGDGVLTHSDLWPEHLLVDEASLELTAIIDWGDAEIGDPAADHAGAWFLAGDEGLRACLEAAGLGWDESMAARARFFGVHHAIGDAWYAQERGIAAPREWALRALRSVP